MKRLRTYRSNPWSRILPILRHLLPMMTVAALFAGNTSEAKAQLLKEMFTEGTSIDSLPERSLRLDLDAFGFFHDNEYDSEMQTGYSLPGVRLNPHLAFKPIPQINIEAGASMLFFNGANKYPCYAYHDIGTWKGNQYQRGCHVLPWVRLQASLKYLDIVVGDIYGGSNHGLITPLFNPEQNISTDPEMGIQILLHRKHILLDTWLNWQSYQFELDTHQEAFTVGTTAKILWEKGEKNASNKTEKENITSIRFYTPIQLVIQHRGGEQDVTAYGVQTLCNASAGVGMSYSPCSKTLNTIDAQVNMMGSYQQSGNIWPFDSGFAWHAGIQTKWWSHLNVGLDYMHAPKQFASLYGNPFYSTFSLKNGGTIVNEDGTLSGAYKHEYRGIHNLRLGIDYQYTFAKAYTLGARAELFSLHSKERKNETGKLSEMNFNFGLYLRVSPSILLKQWKDTK